MDFHGLQNAWTEELQEAEGHANFPECGAELPAAQGRADQSVQMLYAACVAFVESAWGSARLLHPEGPYDDPKGGNLREALYAQVAESFSVRQRQVVPLSKMCTIWVRYSIQHLWRLSRRPYPAFDNISNLFVPGTVDACYLGMTGEGMLFDGIKAMTDGKWDTTATVDRIVSCVLTPPCWPYLCATLRRSPARHHAVPACPHSTRARWVVCCASSPPTRAGWPIWARSIRPPRCGTKPCSRTTAPSWPPRASTDNAFPDHRRQEWVLSRPPFLCGQSPTTRLRAVELQHADGHYDVHGSAVITRRLPPTQQLPAHGRPG
jgi:hypothetical protein